MKLTKDMLRQCFEEYLQKTQPETLENIEFCFFLFGGKTGDEIHSKTLLKLETQSSLSDTLNALDGAMNSIAEKYKHVLVIEMIQHEVNSHVALRSTTDLISRFMEKSK